MSGNVQIHRDCSLHLFLNNNISRMELKKLFKVILQLYCLKIRIVALLHVALSLFKGIHW